MNDSDSDSGEQTRHGRESSSTSRSGSTQKSDKSAASSCARSPSKENSTHSAVKSQSKSKSRSRISSPRLYSPVRSSSSCSWKSQSRIRSRSRSRSRSRFHARSRPHSRSPPSSRPGRQSWSRSFSRDYRDYRRRHGYNHSSQPPRHQWRTRYNPEPNCCVGVFGLSVFTTERDLRDVFSRYGPISDIHIVYDQQSRRSRGFAFVYFENVDDAKEAREIADGMELDGRRIRVDFSITKRPHAPTPGVYMGRPMYSRRLDYYDRVHDYRYGDWDYYSRFYRGGCGVAAAGSGGGWRNGQDFCRRRSPTPYHSRGRYRSRSRSRSPSCSCSRSRPYSPRRF